MRNENQQNVLINVDINVNFDKKKRKSFKKTEILIFTENVLNLNLAFINMKRVLI